jgi:hypothetical protein
MTAHNQCSSTACELNGYRLVLCKLLGTCPALVRLGDLSRSGVTARVPSSLCLATSQSSMWRPSATVHLRLHLWECVDCKLPMPSSIRLIPQTGDCSGRWLLLQSTSMRRST